MHELNKYNNSNAGDTIFVHSGTYYENVNVSKRLILRGVAGGGSSPVVDARGSGSPITIRANGITIDGFYVTGSENNYPNAGIYVQSSNSVIINNTATSNFKGIYIEGGYNNNTIINNNLSFNRNSDVSDGLYTQGSDNNTIINNTVIGNRDEGIQLQIHGHNNIIIGNTILSNGGTGIYLEGSSEGGSMHNTLENNIISNNSFGGIYLIDSNNNKIENNTIIRNVYNGINLYGQFVGGIKNTFIDYVNNTISVYEEYFSSSYNNTIVNNQYLRHQSIKNVFVYNTFATKV